MKKQEMSLAVNYFEFGRNLQYFWSLGFLAAPLGEKARQSCYERIHGRGDSD